MGAEKLRDLGGVHGSLEEALQDPEVGPYLIWGTLLLVPIALVSIFMLRLLLRALKGGPLEPPRWEWPEVLLAFLLWIFFDFSTKAVLDLLDLLLALPPEVPPPVPLLASWALTPFREGVLLAGIAGSRLLAVGLLLGVPVVRGQSLGALGIGNAPPGRGAFQGLVTYLVCIPGVFVVSIGWAILIAAFGHGGEAQQTVERFLGAVRAGHTTVICLFFFVAVVGAPLLEEILFRAITFRWLARRLGTGMGVLLSSLIFGLVHLNLAAFLPVTLLGAILALLYHRTGNLWSPVALHGAYNLCQLLWLMAMASTQQG
ncbi:MAG: lysostaphin resistance A-like protein [Planctomycetota bacterium]